MKMEKLIGSLMVLVVVAFSLVAMADEISVIKVWDDVILTSTSTCLYSKEVELPYYKGSASQVYSLQWSITSQTTTNPILTNIVYEISNNGSNWFQGTASVIIASSTGFNTNSGRAGKGYELETVSPQSPSKWIRFRTMTTNGVNAVLNGWFLIH